jgi:hypothetical protein
MSLGQTKSLHNPKFNSRIGARNVFAVPTADQRYPSEQPTVDGIAGLGGFLVSAGQALGVSSAMRHRGRERADCSIGRWGQISYRRKRSRLEFRW